MYQSEIYQLTYQALLLILLLSGPPIFISMILGLLVAIFQAATQIQEQTLTFVPKMAAVVVILALLGPLGMAQLITFTKILLERFPEMIH